MKDKVKVHSIILVIIIVASILVYLSIDLNSKLKNEENCEELNKTANKNYCYSLLAQKTQDEKICNKISSTTICEKNRCLMDLNRELKTETICEMFDECHISSLSKDECYYTLARFTKNETHCSKVNKKEECFFKLARFKKDELICEHTGEFKENCYKSICKSWETCKNPKDYTFNLSCNTTEINKGDIDENNCILRGGYYVLGGRPCPSNVDYYPEGCNWGPSYCRCPKESELK